MRLRRQYIFPFLLICSSITVSLFLCEAILYLTLPPSHTSEYYIWPPYLNKVFRPNQDLLPGITGTSRFITNSHGIRGDELSSSHTYRILAIGGSTTECLFLDQSETWCYLLQESLNRDCQHQNVWVGNAGMSGITTRHHVTAFKYLPLEGFKIDAIILLIGANDFCRRLSRDKLYDPDYMTRAKHSKDLLAHTFRGRNYKNPDVSFFRKTRICRLMRKITAIKSRHGVQDETGMVYVKWRQHRQNASEIRDELPDLSSALKEYSTNINRIIDLSQKKGIRLIFMTQPAMWKSGLSKDLENLLWFGGIGDFMKESGKPYYSVGALEKGLNIYNDTLRQICQKRGIECLDLSSMVKKDTIVFYDDLHFNESGAREVARILSCYISNHDPFKNCKVFNSTKPL